ncbi:MAG: response regulator [Oscillochloris sp.]|nr:response regulator [Oscillochloris sp.]
MRSYLACPSINPNDSFERQSLDQPERGRILLVEDDQAVRGLVGRFLCHKGYQVTEAQNGLHALEIIAETNLAFQLVLTDVMMPGMGGVDLVNHLRAHSIRCAVIFMTGYYDIELPLNQESMVLHKPFKLQTLLELVHRAIDSDQAITA